MVRMYSVVRNILVVLFLAGYEFFYLENIIPPRYVMIAFSSALITSTTISCIVYVYTYI